MNVLAWITSLRRRLPASLRGRNLRLAARRRALLGLEPLEGIALLAAPCPVISGYVFRDINPINPALTNNGLFDPGESPIPNATVDLYNSAGTLIGVTTSDANGFYEFGQAGNPNLITTPTTTTISQTLTVPNTPTNFTAPLTPNLQLFDPNLGTLTAVKVTEVGTLSSNIAVQNVTPTSTATAQGLLNGTLTVTGLDASLSVTPSTSTPVVTLTPNTPGHVPFTPTSGVVFPPLTASATTTPTPIVLTSPSDLAFFTAGAGRTAITGTVASTGPGGTVATTGNTDYSIRTSGMAVVTVEYDYTPTNCLAPGKYTVVQTPTPNGYTNGKESQNGTVLPSTSPQMIMVMLGTADSPNNDFAKLQPCPTLLSVLQVGVHHQPTELVLNFDMPLNVQAATNPANYTITPLGIHTRPDNLPVAVVNAQYNPGTDQVVLTTNRHLNVHHRYQLQINENPFCGMTTPTTAVFGQRTTLGPITGHHGLVYQLTPGAHLAPVGIDPGPGLALPAGPNQPISAAASIFGAGSIGISSRRVAGSAVTPPAPAPLGNFAGERLAAVDASLGRIAAAGRRRRG